MITAHLSNEAPISHCHFPSMISRQSARNECRRISRGWRASVGPTLFALLPALSPKRKAVERDGVVVGFLLLGFYRSGDFEMSFSILPEHQRKGYAREAASTLADWVFAVFSHLPRLVAVTQHANERSVALLRELNWTETDHFVEFGERQVMFALQNPHPQ